MLCRSRFENKSKIIWSVFSYAFGHFKRIYKMVIAILIRSPFLQFAENRKGAKTQQKEERITEEN